MIGNQRQGALRLINLEELEALASGANAVALGRPILYGLALGGCQHGGSGCIKGRAGFNAGYCP